MKTADNFDALKHSFRDASFIGFVAGLPKLRVFEVTVDVVKKVPLSYIQGDRTKLIMDAITDGRSKEQNLKRMFEQEQQST